MRIGVKLMGMLKSHAPADGQLELTDGASIQDALEVMGVDPESVQAFSVIAPANWPTGTS